MLSSSSSTMWLLLVVFVVVCLCQMATVEGARECSTAREISKIAYDPQTNEYTLVESSGGSGSINVRRRQRRQLPETGVYVNHDDHRRRLQETTTTFGNATKNETDGLEYYYMRSCICSREGRNLYCPIDTPVCYVPRWNTTKGWCERSKGQVRGIRTTWPVIWVWWALVTMGMATSLYGRYGLHYVMSWLVPVYWNRRRIRYLTHQQPDQANRLLQIYHRRNRERNLGLPTVLPINFDPQRLILRIQNNNTDNNGNDENGSMTKPTALALKTRIYRDERQHKKETKTRGFLSKVGLTGSPTNEHGDPNQGGAKSLGDDDEEEQEQHDAAATKKNDEEEDEEEEEDEITCTICFVPLEDGDRVGALPCQHVFHVDCLKVWLQRRNCCPLCQQNGVAAPRYDNHQQEHTACIPVNANDNNNDNNNQDNNDTNNHHQDNNDNDHQVNSDNDIQGNNDNDHQDNNANDIQGNDANDNEH